MLSALSEETNPFIASNVGASNSLFAVLIGLVCRLHRASQILEAPMVCMRH